MDESSQAEHFEEKVGMAMDGALDKSASTRTNSLTALCTAFSKQYVPDLVESRSVGDAAGWGGGGGGRGGHRG